MVDKKITLVPGENGLADIEFASHDSLYNNIWLSLMTRRGARFNNPGFGSRLHELGVRGGRLSAATVTTAKMFAEDALAWLVKSGRVSSVDVMVEPDSMVATRITITVLIARPGNKTITYTVWYDVL